MSTVDQFRDAAFAVLVKQATRMPAFAEFVKEADIDGNEAATLPDSAFAWPEERRFPIHSDKHAAVSYAYALNQSVPAHVVGRIKEALEIYNVPETIFAVTSEKVASDDTVYLLPDLKLFPVQTAADVKIAERHLLENFTKLDLDHRATACVNLVKTASDHGVTLHPSTQQFAGMVVSSTKLASDWLDARSNRTKDVTIKAGYAKLAAEMRKHGPEIKDRDTLIKLASVIAELDEKAGLVKHYDRKLPDAIATIFNTQKEAASSVDLGGGSMVSLKKLASLSADFWRDLGGKELSDEVAPGGVVDPSKLAMIVETLPLDLRVILRSQLGV